MKTLTEQFKRLWSDEKRRVNLLAAMGTLGIALLALSSLFPKEKTVQADRSLPEQSSYAEELEQRLESLISQVDGAGKTSVLVTAAGGEETVYAADETQEADGSRQLQHVLLGGGGAQGLVETVRTPQILGVAVVCEGGGSIIVQKRIIDIVQALTDVGASHITVTKMTS